MTVSLQNVLMSHDNFLVTAYEHYYFNNIIISHCTNIVKIFNKFNKIVATGFPY